MTYKKLLLGGIAALTFAGFLMIAQPQPASALFENSKEAACEGIQGTSSGGECTTGGTSLDDIVTMAIEILSVVIGLVAVIMIIVGGFKYITANGDSGNLQSAKNTIVYAVIGLIIVAFAQFMVQFVLDETTKKPNTNQPAP